MYVPLLYMWTPSVSLNQEFKGVEISGLSKNHFPLKDTTLATTEMTRRTRSLAICKIFHFKKLPLNTHCKFLYSLDF